MTDFGWGVRWACAEWNELNSLSLSAAVVPYLSPACSTLTPTQGHYVMNAGAVVCDWSTAVIGTYLCHVLPAVFNFHYCTWSLSDVSAVSAIYHSHSCCQTHKLTQFEMCTHTHTHTHTHTLRYCQTQILPAEVSRAGPICPEKCQTPDTLTDIYWSWRSRLRVHERLNVNSQQAVTSHWSQSITDCVRGSTAIPAMFWPREPEQLIGPNMGATNGIKWLMTSYHKVHAGASLHLPQEQLHNTAHARTRHTVPRSRSIERGHGSRYISNITARWDIKVMASHLRALWNYIRLKHTCVCKALK